MYTHSCKRDHIGHMENLPFDSGIAHTPTHGTMHALSQTQLFSSGDRVHIFPTVTERINVNEFSGFSPNVTTTNNLSVPHDRDETYTTAVTHVVTPTHTHTTPSVCPRVRTQDQVRTNLNAHRHNCNHIHVSSNDTTTNVGLGDSVSHSASMQHHTTPDATTTHIHSTPQVPLSSSPSITQLYIHQLRTSFGPNY